MSWWKMPLRNLFSGSREDHRDSSSREGDGTFILSNRYVAGKLLPSNPTGRYHLLLKAADSREHDSHLAVPPKEMWEGYGFNEKEYLGSGLKHLTAMLEILENAGANPQSLKRVLDFGCAAGRMLRFYPHNNDGSELWGADINAKYVGWCQQHLSPPFLFTTITTLPHLPFEDNRFDLVYCGSVFTHITDLADAWFLEIQRVLRKGAFAYITIHDKSSLQIVLANHASTAAKLAPSELTWEKPDGEPGTSSAGAYWINEFNKTVDLDSLNYASFSFSEDPYSNIFYDTDFIVDKWSRFSEFVSMTPSAYGCQTALLFRKR
jgi:SAM-dependent methyltransferase